MVISLILLYDHMVTLSNSNIKYKHLLTTSVANAVILEGNTLSDDFVKLRTGLAGAVLQKFGNYNIKVAVVIQDDQNFPARFKEMVAEHRVLA